VPVRGDLDPARAANAPDVMKETEATATAYLAAHPPRRDASGQLVADAAIDYVRAHLCCALLAQGRVEEGYEAARDIRPLRARNLVDRRIALREAASYLAGLCRAILARAALEEMFEGRMAIEEFVRRHGGFVGIQLPGRDSPDYEKVLALEAGKVRSYCFTGTMTPERVQYHRGELRRMASEQIHNESAALINSLPEPAAPGEADETAALELWLAKVAVGSAVIHRYLIEDLLPSSLSNAQKEWQREIAYSYFRRAEELCDRFLDAETRERIPQTWETSTPEEELYAQLLRARETVLAWITLR